MHIGYCYERKSDVFSTGDPREGMPGFHSESTLNYINAVTSAIESLGHTVEYIGGLKALFKRLAECDDSTCSPSSSGGSDGKPHRLPWDLVFNDVEGTVGTTRESQAPALMEVYKCPFTYSDAATINLTVDKGTTKMFLEHHGIPTAPFAVVSNPLRWKSAIPSADEVISEEQICHAIASSCHRNTLQTYPLFVKPSSDSTSEGISSISKCKNLKDLHRAVSTVAMAYPEQDILVESFLPGREFTVAIGGTGNDAKVIGVREFGWASGGSDFLVYETKVGHLCGTGGIEWKSRPDIKGDEVVREACETALAAWKALRCADMGRVDVRFDGGGRANVMEVNPISNMIKGSSALPVAAAGFGYSYEDLFRIIIDSAVKRYEL